MLFYNKTISMILSLMSVMSMESMSISLLLQQHHANVDKLIFSEVDNGWANVKKKFMRLLKKHHERSNISAKTHDFEVTSHQTCHIFAMICKFEVKSVNPNFTSTDLFPPSSPSAEWHEGQSSGTQKKTSAGSI